MGERESALATQVGLEVGHEKSGGDPFARDISDDEAELLLAEIEKVEVVAADLSSLQAEPGVFERFGLGMNLRKQARLDLLGDFDFLRHAAFGFELLCQRTTMSFHAAGQFVETREAEAVAVGIMKTGVDTSPCRRLRRKLELDPSGAPLFVLTIDVLGDKPDARLRTNQSGNVVLGLKRRQA